MSGAVPGVRRRMAGVPGGGAGTGNSGVRAVPHHLERRKDAVKRKEWIGQRAKEALLEPERRRTALEAARERLERRMGRRDQVTAAYGGERVSLSGGDLTGELWAESADLAEEVRRRREEAEKARQALKRQLAELGAGGEKQWRSALLLYHRYVLCRDWRRVRDELERQGFPATERTVCNWHKEAVRQMEELLERK